MVSGRSKARGKDFRGSSAGGGAVKTPEGNLTVSWKSRRRVRPTRGEARFSFFFFFFFPPKACDSFCGWVYHHQRGNRIGAEAANWTRGCGKKLGRVIQPGVWAEIDTWRLCRGGARRALWRTIPGWGYGRGGLPTNSAIEGARLAEVGRGRLGLGLGLLFHSGRAEPARETRICGRSLEEGTSRRSLEGA